MIFDALIVGGGPAGSTTACLLAQAGWSVAIVEKRIFPSRKVCGEFISATSLPLLQKMGVADFYLSQGGPEVRRMGLFTANSVLHSTMPSADRSLHHWGRALGRESLDSILLDSAVCAGAKSWQPWNVKNFQRKLSLFHTTITSGHKIKMLSSRIVIMANGSWENGFEMWNGYRHKSSDLLAFKAHYTDCELANDLMPLLTFPGGYGGLVHSDGGRVTLSCCIRRDTLQEIRKSKPGLPAGEVVLDHLRSTCFGVRQALTQAKREGGWLSAGPIRPGIRRPYSAGIFYVGNIAGEAHPVIAEGISMAMQAAWLLSQKLLAHQNEILAGKTLNEVGQVYTQQWNTHFARRIHAAALFAQLTMRPWTMGAMLPILKKFPGILTLGAKWSGKINQVVPRVISTK